MKKIYTCIICPRSCELEAEILPDGQVSVSGNGCPRGAEWIRDELSDPKRTIASSVLVEGGEKEIVSVRLSSPVPLRMIFPIMDEIRKVSVTAPVSIGDIIIRDVLSSGADVIATSSVLAKKE